MIKVTRIAGESFDFETRKETPKALILSNGKREFVLYVDDDVAEAVLRMMLELDVPVSAPAKSNGSSTGLAVPAPRAPVQQGPKPTPRMAEVSHDENVDLSDDNSGFEPGEAYNDPATGAESL
jgi:hypothetical protein